MRTALILVAMCVAVALGQIGTDVPDQFTVNAETQPYGSSICALDGKWKSIDKSAWYKPSFAGVKRLCVKDYLTVCATAQGAQACNSYNAQCVDSAYDFSDASQHPDTAAIMVSRPEVCSDQGMFSTPDTATILVAQIVVSGVVFIGVFVLFVIQAQPSILIKALAGVFLLDCLLMLFSYFYLNAIIIFTAVIAAGICFSLKSDSAAAVGFGICLAALFWTTFAAGLGNVQHQSRFTAGDATTDSYEKQCNNYYRGYFFFPLDLHKDDENVAISFRGLCDREWLGAQLFFMIFAQQLLVVFMAAGAQAQFGDAREGEAGFVKQIEVARPQQQ
jgi:hypothetical protein